ncbi:MAG: type II CAAX endopeptidase family protein [Thermoplasmatota archaeon]
MDFTFKKPKHILALLILVMALTIIVLLPLYTYYTQITTTSSLEQIPPQFRYAVELFTLIIQLIFVAIGLFIIVPILWYKLVNKYSFKQIFNAIKLRREAMDIAILWGMLTMIAMFVILFIIGIILTTLGYNLDQSGNIKDLEGIFSVPSIFILVSIQPIGEEIFFRGFLLEKIQNTKGKIPAILITSILFGIAHLSYANIYPALITAILGVILAYMVIKTKHLITAISAHIFYNIISVSLYIIGSSFF